MISEVFEILWATFMAHWKAHTTERRWSPFYQCNLCKRETSGHIYLQHGKTASVRDTHTLCPDCHKSGDFIIPFTR